MQRSIFQELRLHEIELPQLRYVIHIPNEGKRTKVGGKLAKDGGLSPGVLDMTALTGIRWALELKAGDNTPTPAQSWWMQKLHAGDGGLIGLAYNAGEAIEFILYMYTRRNQAPPPLAYWRAFEWLNYLAESGQMPADPRQADEDKSRGW